LGAAAIEKLREKGLDTSAVFTTDAAETSATVVAVEPGGVRCLFHTAGATPRLDAAALRRCSPVVARGRCIQIGHVGLLPVLTTEAAQTSATVVAVEPGGERCFCRTPGATPLLDAAALRRCFPVFARCRYIQIGYFGLLPGLTADLPAVLPELRRAAPQAKIA